MKIFKTAAAAFFITALGSMVSVSAQTDVEIGDYISLGRYNGSPIIWRVADNDNNGILVVSNEILCLKEYDAAGIGGTHSYDKSREAGGSPVWSESNLRAWLNSSADGGDVEWYCGNTPSYNDENGFLHSDNFSDGEKMLMKEVMQKTIVHSIDTGIEGYVSGSDFTIIKNNTWDQDLSSNYESCAYEMVTDRVFIPDSKQAEAIKKNLGKDYLIGRYADTTKFTWLRQSAGNYYAWSGILWNSIPASDGFGAVWRADANTECGVRPAFYLSDNASIVSGRGTEDEPYILSYKEKWGIEDVQINDTGVNVTISRNDNVSGNEKLIAAFHDIDGENIGIFIKDIDSSDKYTFEFDRMSDVNEVKLFMWNDMELLIPMTEKVVKKTAPTIHIVSDSTAADWENPESVAHLVTGVTNYYPQSGWAMMLENYIMERTAEINNKAIPGCTAQMFISAYLPELKTEIRQGDYVIIQFGHNDQKKYGIEEYKGYMTQLADSAEEMGASVIFVTSPVRLQFSDGVLIDYMGGYLNPVLGDYAEATKELSQELNIPVIDLNAKSRELVSELGEDEAKNLYLFLSKNDDRFISDERFSDSYNNKELKDGAHLLPYGADTYARIVAEGIEELNISLSKYITLDHVPKKP